MKIGEYTNTYSNPQALKKLMQQRQQQAQQGLLFEAGDDAKHERAKWVEATRQMLGKDQHGNAYTFGRINGLTKTWAISKIRDRYFYCKKQPRPAFVWWGIRRKEIQEKNQV